jgi:hypothetical protein
MPHIGATLRDARQRANIDIHQVEAQTKIRAKYLHALENEDWHLLPGTAYVKGFLRTYADALGLDSKLLLEEYKMRYERPAELEMQPIVPRRPEEARERRSLPREWAIGLVVLAILAALFALGKLNNQSSNDQTAGQRSPVVPPTTTPAQAHVPAHAKPKPSPFVQLRLVPTGLVYVCLEAAGNRRLIPGVILQPNQPLKTFRSSKFRLTVGNSNLQMKINGKLRTVPPVADGIGYLITKKGRKVLEPQARPTCT